tara:strand:+ start:159 stop:506 length:348 start_codon:yes stop_codon:yes gene_type:complete
MKTPREARVFTIHCTMAPRTRVVKRRESSLADQYTEDLNESLDDVSESLHLVNKIAAQMIRIVRQIEAVDQLSDRFYELMDQYRQLRTEDLPLAEMQYRQSFADHARFMYNDLPN